MWKDKKSRKKIAYFSKYVVSGRNIEALLNILKSNKIEMKNVKRKNANTLILSINSYDNTKFFAITCNLCYTIKKIKDYGRLFPLYKAIQNIGIMVGVLFFIAFSYISNGYIFSISYSGSGSVYQREIENTLSHLGIKEKTKFSSFNLNDVASQILIENDNLTFVSLKKHGNTLCVYANKGNNKIEQIDSGVNKIYSTVSGIVESIKVYRGTAVVGVGDSVKENDLLVDGVAYLKDFVNTTNVLANISIIGEISYSYSFDSENMGDFALMFAKQDFDGEIIDSEVICEKNNDSFIYTIKLKYRTIIKVG